MSITAIDRCTFGQHDSHEVVACEGTKFWPCQENVCRDHLEHCYQCNVDVCPACMEEHKDGDCFSNTDDDEDGESNV